MIGAIKIKSHRPVLPCGLRSWFYPIYRSVDELQSATIEMKATKQNFHMHDGDGSNRFIKQNINSAHSFHFFSGTFLHNFTFYSER